MQLPFFCNLSSTDIFWASALFGSALFILRIIAGSLGDFFDSTDNHDGFDTDHGHPSVKIFTLHSIAGFFMMFGFSGLACLEYLPTSPAITYAAAVLVGSMTLLITAALFHYAYRLESPGSVITLDQAVGTIGTVYQTIPVGGQGKVQLTINGVTREVIAQACNEQPIESFTKIMVVRIIDHETVQVIILNNQ